jgi:hypothetical protein
MPRKAIAVERMSVSRDLSARLGFILPAVAADLAGIRRKELSERRRSKGVVEVKIRMWGEKMEEAEP